MIVSITYLKLKHPFKLFALGLHSSRINKQLQTSSCLDFKTKSGILKHYTMTLWDSEEDLLEFMLKGAHHQAMTQSLQLAKEIKTIRIPSANLPTWEQAKKYLVASSSKPSNPLKNNAA